MRLLHKFDTLDDARFWLAKEEFTPWADGLGLDIFHCRFSHAFVRLRFADNCWLIEIPVTKPTNEKEKV
jgi:hypothetical protein